MVAYDAKCHAAAQWAEHRSSNIAALLIVLSHILTTDCWGLLQHRCQLSEIMMQNKLNLKSAIQMFHMFHIIIHMFTITAYEPIPVFNIKILTPTHPYLDFFGL